MTNDNDNFLDKGLGLPPLLQQLPLVPRHHCMPLPTFAPYPPRPDDTMTVTLPMAKEPVEAPTAKRPLAPLPLPARLKVEEIKARIERRHAPTLGDIVAVSPRPIRTKLPVQALPPAPVRRHIAGPTIKLYGGTYFHFLHPDESEYTIEDIAHALSQINRFNGHTPYPYSVAQHSVLASYHVQAGFEYDALMHDAPEAFVGDVTSPMGSLLPDFKALKKRIETSVAQRFGFAFPLPEAVKFVDLQMLKAEQYQLMDAANDDWAVTASIPLPPVVIEHWEPEDAKRLFLARFHELRARDAGNLAA